jgi:hypothetical protein
MKFRTYAIISILLILTGCNPNNPTPNPPTPTVPNPVQTSWTMTVDNNTYSWADNYITLGGGDTWVSEHYETNPGSCNWQFQSFQGSSSVPGGEVHLSTSNLPGFTEDGLDCTIQFYPNNTGSFIINSTSYQSTSPSDFAIFISDYPLIQNIVRPGGGFECQINTNITTFSTVKGGLVEGNFSGTFKDIWGQTHTVSGQFSVIRTE